MRLSATDNDGIFPNADPPLSSARKSSTCCSRSAASWCGPRVAWRLGPEAHPSWSIRVNGPLVVFDPAGEGLTVQLAHRNSQHNGLSGVHRGDELKSISDAVGPWMLQAIPDHGCRPFHHSDQSVDDVTPGLPPVEASPSGQAAIELLVLVKDPFGGRIKGGARLGHPIPYVCGG